MAALFDVPRRAISVRERTASHRPLAIEVDTPIRVRETDDLRPAICLRVIALPSEYRRTPELERTLFETGRTLIEERNRDVDPLPLLERYEIDPGA